MKFRLIVLLILAIEVCCELTRPEIIASTATIYRTKTSHLKIAGFNFPSPDLYKVTLTFEPELIEGVEYTVSVASTTELDVTLLAGHAWRAEAGKLLVKSMIFDDRNGGFQIFPHASDDWTVSEVVADARFVEDEFVTRPRLLATEAPVFQFALQQQPIVISGAGFTSDLSLVLDPPLVVNVDYTLTVTAPSAAVLTLLPGKKWRKTAGPLLARSIKCGGFERALNDEPIAMIVADFTFRQNGTPEPPVVFHPDEIDHAAKFDDAISDEEWDDDDDFLAMDDGEWRANRERMFERWEAFQRVPSFHYFSSQWVRRALQSVDGAVDSDLAVLTLLTARDLRPCLVVLSSIAVLLVLYRYMKINKQHAYKDADHTHAAACLV